MKLLQYLYAKLKSKLNKDMVILAVDVANKSTMTFKNGSVIEYLDIKETDVIRGRGSTLPIFYDDYDYDKNNKLDQELDSLINKHSK
ncbi:MAG TPA: hypothetical protein VIK72_09450 [Clostridiaceae bacterium]